MGQVRYAFLGATRYSAELLEFLIGQGLPPALVFFIPEEFQISYSDKPVKNSNYADIRAMAEQEQELPMTVQDAHMLPVAQPSCRE